jgi:hypothetical protein
MSKKIQGVAIRKNHQEFNYGKTVFVNAEGAITEGAFWRVPVTDARGFFKQYDYVIAAARPTVDAVKCVRVRNTIDVELYWLVIADSDNGSVFNGLCNAAENGSTPTMPFVNIPDPLPEIVGSYVDGTNTKFIAVTDNTGVDGTAIGWGVIASKNGALFTPTHEFDLSSNLTTLVSTLNTDWGSSGANVFAVLNPATGIYEVTLVMTAAHGSVVVMKNYKFTSNTPGAFGSENNYQLVVTANGVSFDPVVGTTLANVVIAAQNNTQLNALGKFTANGTTNINLITHKATSVTLVITKVTL